MSGGRPRRKRYKTESDWLVASLRWLEYRWPGQNMQPKRVRKWAQLEREAASYFDRGRLLQLLYLDRDLTKSEEAELADLTARHHKHKQTNKTTRSTP